MVQLFFFLILFTATRRQILNSSCMAFSSSILSSNNKIDDIAVFGCGVLGTSLCQQILKSNDFDGLTVTGITKSTTKHESIRDAMSNNNRFRVLTYEDSIKQGKTFRNVVFCAPPSGFDDYPAAVKEVAETVYNGEGTMVFTSAGSVYGGFDGETVNEKSPVTSDAPRAKRLLAAEAACPGIVLRLAGLYTLERGAHNYWLGKDEVAGREDGLINLLHYDDAAGACMAALLKQRNKDESNIYLISDGHPLTRKQICESAKKAKLYADKQIPNFLGSKDKDPKGKMYDGSRSNKELNWKPRYNSFDEFMSSSQS